MEPTLGQDWEQQVRLAGEFGRQITEEAISSLKGFYVVPCAAGGIQLEVHRDSFDIEITIGPAGEIESGLVRTELASFGQ